MPSLRQARRNKGEQNMSNENQDAVNKVKSELRSGLMAIGLALIGGLLLVGAAYFYIMPLLNGEGPNLVMALVLGIPGGIMEIIGDWKLMMLKFKKQDERIAAMRNK